MQEIVAGYAQKASSKVRATMQEAFEKSCYYEVAFWQMAYTKHCW